MWRYVIPNSGFSPLPSGAYDPDWSSITEGHSVASLRSGKSAVASDLHLSSSTTGHLPPNVKSGKVDGAHTVAISFSQIANYSPSFAKPPRLQGLPWHTANDHP